MRGKARFVFDTNVLVSASLFSRSKPGQALRWALQHGEVLMSLALLQELEEVLRREKLQRYVSSARREEFLEALIERAVFLEPAEAIRACRDPKDDKVLELAIAGKAQLIVSGDQDLLTLSPFRGVEVLRPEEFLGRSTLN